ncbi:hypothetical protein D3C76_1108340 [compost metagenome]
MLGGQVTHIRLRRQAQFGQFGGGFETDFAAVRRQHPVVVHALQHRADKVFQTEGIGDQANLRTTAHPRQGQLLGQRGADLVLGNEAERQLIAAGLACAGDFDFTQQYRMLGIAKTHAVGQVNLFDGRILAGEPAAVLQPVWQDALLQRRARWGLEQFFHAFFQHQRGEVRQALCRLHVPARHLVFRGEAEPVETVGRQGQEETQLADRWKGVTAEHLHRHHADVCGQVQFHRLGAARNVGHTQDDFVLAVRAGVFAGIGQHPAVGR